jgi:hypothetical protein
MAGFNLPSFAQAATNLWSCQKPNKDLPAVWDDEISDIIIAQNPYIMDDPQGNDSEFFDFGDPATGLSFMTGKRWYQSVYTEACGGSLPYKIMGIAKDAAGLPKAGCRALLYLSDGDVKIVETVTDDLGIYAFQVSDTVTQYYVKVFQVSPPLAGISVRTLTGA